jgi:hypothetical protein
MKSLLLQIGRQFRKQYADSSKGTRCSCVQRKTRAKVAHIAGKKLRDHRYDAEIKSVLASALSQAAPKQCPKRRPKRQVLGLNGYHY